MNKLTDLINAINESRIYLDGNDAIDWELLEYHVMKDQKLKNIKLFPKIMV